MPDVSVVVPTYNRVDLVAVTVQSVLAQTHPSFEVIVVDDGSQDGTGAVVKAIPDPRIRYIHQENTGLGGARNTGIREARGRYVAFLDSDDLFYPDNLALQVEQLRRHPEAGLAAGGYRFVNEAGQPLAERRPWLSHPRLDVKDCLHGIPVVPSAVVVRTEWLTRVGGFDPLLRRAEDVDLWLRLAYHGCEMVWTPHMISAYRTHPGQMVHDGRRQKEVTLSVLDKFFGQPSLPPEMHQEHDEAYARTYLSGAFREYGANQVRFAKESLGRAIDGIPALMTGNIPALTHTLMGWAVSPITGDPTAFAERVLGNLPDSATRLGDFRQRLLCAVAVRAAADANLVGNHGLARRHLVNALENDVSSFADPTLIVEQLVDYLRGQQTRPGVELLKCFFENLPAELDSLCQHRRRAIAQLWMARAFDSYGRGELADARRAVVRGVYYDQAWLQNRGVRSILVRSMVAGICPGDEHRHKVAGGDDLFERRSSL